MVGCAGDDGFYFLVFVSAARLPDDAAGLGLYGDCRYDRLVLCRLPHDASTLIWKGGFLTGASSAGSIAAVASDIGTLVTSSVSWIGSFIGAITSNPLILMFVIFGFIGTGVGLLKRLMRG